MIDENKQMIQCLRHHQIITVIKIILFTIPLYQHLHENLINEHSLKLETYNS
jgi:hypothetical protein